MAGIHVPTLRVDDNPNARRRADGHALAVARADNQQIEPLRRQPLQLHTAILCELAFHVAIGGREELRQLIIVPGFLWVNAYLVISPFRLHVLADFDSVGALERRLRALLEASERGAFVPGPHLGAEWWKNGPFLLSHKLTSGAERVEWIAARVEAVEDKVLHLRVARVNGSKEPQIGTLEMPFRRFDQWSIDEKATEMSRGRF